MENILQFEIGQSEKRKYMTGIVVQSVLHAYRKITTEVQERKRNPSFYTMAAFSSVCRSISKLLDGKTTGQLSETRRHYRILHNLGCLKGVFRWQSH